MTDKRRGTILLVLSILILLLSAYAVTIDPLIGGVGLTVGLITLYNAYQAYKGITPRVIRKGQEREEERLKEEAQRETMYTRMQRQNQERARQKREEEAKEQKHNL